MELALPRDELFIELAASQFDALHHRFELVDHARQRAGLRLQRAEGLAPLVR